MKGNCLCTDTQTHTRTLIMIKKFLPQPVLNSILNKAKL